VTRTLLLLFPLLAACGEDEELVISEMERALRGANAAMVAELVTLELLDYTFEDPDNQLRHGELCGCPCVDRVGAPPDPYVLTLEYDAGCLPQSSLLPSVLSGTAVLDWDGTTAHVTLPDLVLGLEHEVRGTIDAAITDGVPRRVEATASLTIGDLTVDHLTTVDLSDDDIVFDGTISTELAEAADLSLAAVRLMRSDIGGACPDPTSGTATLAADPEVVLDFGTPGGGFVLLTRDNRTSEKVDFCQYQTDLF
jgi:hypothetical protein